MADLDDVEQADPRCKTCGELEEDCECADGFEPEEDEDDDNEDFLDYEDDDEDDDDDDEEDVIE